MYPQTSQVVQVASIPHIAPVGVLAIEILTYSLSRARSFALVFPPSLTPTSPLSRCNKTAMCRLRQSPPEAPGSDGGGRQNSIAGPGRFRYHLQRLSFPVLL